MNHDARGKDGYDRRKLFWIGLIALFTAASELARGQWVQIALTEVVGMQGILLLVHIFILMFVFRHFAGSVAEGGGA